MTDRTYKYQIRQLITVTVLWEVIFWGILLAVYFLFGFGNLSSKEGLAFKNDKALWLFIFVPVISGLYFLNKIKQNERVKGKSKQVFHALFPPVSTIKSFFKMFFFRNAIVFAIIALAQPVHGTKKVKGTTESLELVIALDVSNSMNCKDISETTSRLEISKRAIIQLINNLHGERIGICVFANSAFVQLPITLDYSAAKMFVKDIETQMISDQGTNISQALDISAEMFSKKKTTKGIILVTDGEDHEKQLDQTLKNIKDKQIQLSVLGIGTSKGGLIPKSPYRPELGYKTDARGKTVVTRLNKDFIKEIAKKANGYASVSSKEFPNLSDLLTQINQMKRTKIDTLEFDVKREQYQIPLFLSILCLLLYIGTINSRKNETKE